MEFIVNKPKIRYVYLDIPDFLGTSGEKYFLEYSVVVANFGSWMFTICANGILFGHLIKLTSQTICLPI
jgi:hypothetical protein